MLKKVVDVYGTWCGPCKAYKPTFEKVSKMDEFKDIEFVEMDVDEHDEEAAKYNVRGVPATLFLDEKDELIERLAGLQTEAALVEKIKSLV